MRVDGPGTPKSGAVMRVKVAKGQRGAFLSVSTGLSEQARRSAACHHSCANAEELTLLCPHPGPNRIRVRNA
jgi:hypothetical protein